MKSDEMLKYYKIITDDYPMFLSFLRAKYPIFHNSNIFYRDFQYGIKRFLEKKEFEVSYPQAEDLANRVSKYLEEKGVFVKVNSLGWKLNYPEFVTSVPGDPFDMKNGTN